MIEKLLYLFVMGSIIGWCLEALFRRFCTGNRTHKWVNPGFLTGPYLPLYGFGLCALFLLAELEKKIPLHNAVASKLCILIFMTLSMTLLELIAGMIFIHGMKLKLWDYSDRPFNFKGVICLEFSVLWFLLAAVYCLLIHPFMQGWLQVLTGNRLFLFPLGFISGIMAVDFGYTVQITKKIKQFAKENNILIRYEELKANIRKHTEERKGKYSAIFAFRTNIPLSEHLKNYAETYSKLKKLTKKIKRNKNSKKQ